MVAVVVLAAATPVWAQPAAPAVDPAAIAALDGMTAYLRTLKVFQVVSTTTTDEVLDDGQTALDSAKTTILAEMPNRLFATTSGERSERTYVYDGKSFTLFARRAGYYATVPAPATLRELDDVLGERYDIEIPLADLFRWGGPTWSSKDIVAAADAGPSQVNGVTCRQYLFRQEGVDWQVWIQLGAFPLPRKLVITTTSDPARPRHAAVLDWNLAPSYSPETFTFVAPAGAHPIKLATLPQQGAGENR
jgi:hypothetical protein